MSNIEYMSLWTVVGNSDLFEGHSVKSNLRVTLCKMKRRKGIFFNLGYIDRYIEIYI